MKRTKRIRLEVKRERIRVLREADLDAIDGGIYTDTNGTECSGDYCTRLTPSCPSTR